MSIAQPAWLDDGLVAYYRYVVMLMRPCKEIMVQLAGAPSGPTIDLEILASALRITEKMDV